MNTFCAAVVWQIKIAITLKQMSTLLIIIYIRLFGEAINLCIQYCLAEVPGCDEYYKNIGQS